MRTPTPLPLRCYLWFAVLCIVLFIGTIWESLQRVLWPLLGVLIMLAIYYVSFRLAVGW